jgi:hypothetical protein
MQLGGSDNINAALITGMLIQDTLLIDSSTPTAYRAIFGGNSNSVAYSELMSVGISVPISTVPSTIGSIGVLNFTVNGQVQIFSAWGQNLLP